MNKKIDEMKLTFIYLHELWWLTEAIKLRCDELFRNTQVPDKGFYIKNDYHIHYLINDILSNAANISKLITTPEIKPKNKSADSFRIHIERSKFLQGKIDGVDFSEIKSVKVRNTLQHFDEYLDQANIEASDSRLNAYGMAFYNLVMSHWEAINPRPYPLRLYICAEKKYYNIKYSVDIGKINSEASSINNIIREEFVRNNIPEPGGIAIPLNPKNMQV